MELNLCYKFPIPVAYKFVEIPPDSYCLFLSGHRWLKFTVQGVIIFLSFFFTFFYVNIQQNITILDVIPIQTIVTQHNLYGKVRVLFCVFKLGR